MSSRRTLREMRKDAEEVRKPCNAKVSIKATQGLLESGLIVRGLSIQARLGELGTGGRGGDSPASLSGQGFSGRQRCCQRSGPRGKTKMAGDCTAELL